ncbi:MAG: GTPase Era [Hyphomicrobiaceae bacterium]
MPAENDNGGGPAPVGAAARRCGFIAVIGAPNAGKSTLVNTLVGTKVTIVSRKVQTTRMAIRGIATEGASQLVFVDTPGIFTPRRRLDRAMVDAAWGRAGEADVIVLIVDAVRGVDDEVERILARMGGVARPVLLVINKVDRLADKSALLALTTELTSRHDFAEVFMISALSGSGTAKLKETLARMVPEGPWHYADDDVTDMPLRVLAAEITRERIYDRLHEELPYAIAVETTAWKELRDGSVRIEQTIFVERDSQRRIVLGKGGETVKLISSEARKELAGIVERPVHLFLFVKVKENWGDDPERYRDIGLDYPKD